MRATSRLKRRIRINSIRCVVLTALIKLIVSVSAFIGLWIFCWSTSISLVNGPINCKQEPARGGLMLYWRCLHVLLTRLPWTRYCRPDPPVCHPTRPSTGSNFRRRKWWAAENIQSLRLFARLFSSGMQSASCSGQFLPPAFRRIIFLAVYWSTRPLPSPQAKIPSSGEKQKLDELMATISRRAPSFAADVLTRRFKSIEADATGDTTVNEITHLGICGTCNSVNEDALAGANGLPWSLPCHTSRTCAVWGIAHAPGYVKSTDPSLASPLARSLYGCLTFRLRAQRSPLR